MSASEPWRCSGRVTLGGDPGFALGQLLPRQAAGSGAYGEWGATYTLLFSHLSLTLILPLPPLREMPGTFTTPGEPSLCCQPSVVCLANRTALDLVPTQAWPAPWVLMTHEWLQRAERGFQLLIWHLGFLHRYPLTGRGIRGSWGGKAA